MPNTHRSPRSSRWFQALKKHGFTLAPFPFKSGRWGKVSPYWRGHYVLACRSCRAWHQRHPGALSGPWVEPTASGSWVVSPGWKPSDLQLARFLQHADYHRDHPDKRPPCCCGMSGALRVTLGLPICPDTRESWNR